MKITVVSKTHISHSLKELADMPELTNDYSVTLNVQTNIEQRGTRVRVQVSKAEFDKYSLDQVIEET